MVSRASDGDPTEVQRAVTVNSVTTTESYQYAYTSSGTNAGKLSSVTLRRQVGSGSWSTVRQAEYAYYGSSESHGNLGDLKTATIKDGSGTTIDTSYYRYYTGESGGYTGALKYRFSAASYARLAGAFSNPLTATDTQVSGYADQYLEYDEAGRVSAEVVQGAGCTTCGGNSLGTYTFTYTASTFPDGYNNWARKIVETLPDGTVHIIYCNCIGEIIIDIYIDVTTEDEWVTYHRYDSDGRLILRAHPSSVSGIDESRPDLLNNQSGNYSFLRDGEGLIETISYYTSTTATETTAGGATGYQYQAKVQRGETGTAILQSTTQYYARTDCDATIYPVANETRYRNADGSGGQTTSYSYTWFSSSTQIQSVTVTMPTVSTSQNGPGSADVTTTFYDEYGRPIWHKDGDGFLTYTAYDQATGAVTKTITDVNTSNTSDFANLPSGWSTPSGGGPHLITLMEVDHLGRTTKLTDPNGNVTYTVYDDDNYEVRVYPGWNSSWP